ncbi:MAG: outer membrane protein assembly factor BamD [Planctomycetota bacterium]
MNRRRIGLAGGVLLLCLTPWVRADWVWHKERGWIETGALPRDTDQQQYDHALALLTDDKYESALAEFNRLLKTSAGGEFGEKIEVRCIECYWRMGKEWEAYRQSEAFFASHPGSRFTDEVLTFEFRAGANLLDRGKRSGVTVLEAVLSHQPEGPMADDCYFQIAEYHRREKHYGRAQTCYGNVVERFPASDLAPEALLGASVCALYESREQKSPVPEKMAQVQSNLQQYEKNYGKRPNARDVSLYSQVAEGLQHYKRKYEVRFFYGLLYYADGRYKKALDTFAKSAKKLKGTDLGGDARFYTAECQFHMEEHYKAFKTLEKFFEENPGHVREAEAGARQFEICALLKKKDPKTAAWAYERVVQRSPYSTFADDAQMELGNCRFELRRYADARTAYEALLKTYPDSEWYGAAIFQTGRCYLEESKQVNVGMSLRLKAEERFDEYITKYSTGIKVADARNYMKEIKEAKAKDHFEVAEFYLRVKRPAAALVYFDVIQRDFADTKWASLADEKAKEIRSGKRGKG